MKLYLIAMRNLMYLILKYSGLINFELCNRKQEILDLFKKYHFR